MLDLPWLVNRHPVGKGTVVVGSLKGEPDCSLSFCLLQVLVLDGRGHLLGRLAAIVAKQVLLGKFLSGFSS